MKHFSSGIAVVLVGLANSSNAQHLLQDGTRVAPPDVFEEFSACPEMIVLPMGGFMMGGPVGDPLSPFVWRGGRLVRTTPDDPLLGATERPVHRGKIDQPIAIG